MESKVFYPTIDEQHLPKFIKDHANLEFFAVMTMDEGEAVDIRQFFMVVEVFCMAVLKDKMAKMPWYRIYKALNETAEDPRLWSLSVN